MHILAKFSRLRRADFWYSLNLLVDWDSKPFGNTQFWCKNFTISTKIVKNFPPPAVEIPKAMYLFQCIHPVFFSIVYSKSTVFTGKTHFLEDKIHYIFSPAEGWFNRPFWTNNVYSSATSFSWGTSMVISPKIKKYSFAVRK